MTDFEVIRGAVDNIHYSVDLLESNVTEDECAKIRHELDYIEKQLDDFEPPEEDEITALIPENMSAGEVDSLKEVICNWRTEHGYSNC